nr:hypothetical protein [uncultured Mucilaginibacter sp.]
MKPNLYFVLIPFFILIISCNTTERKANKSSDSFTEDEKSDSTKRPEAVALRFYNWYIKEMYPDSSIDKPTLKITADSVYQLIADTQFETLRKTGFFSKDFFHHQSHIYSACNLSLKKIDIKKVEDCGCSPTEFVNNESCSFFSYYAWVGGQGENITNAKVVSTNVKGNYATVKMEILADGIPYSHPKVTEFKENGVWKIAVIDLEW